MHDPAPTDGLRLDLGCGSAKRPGYVGLDHVEGPGVDHVLDLTTERLPFDDDSVCEIYSAHFFEHVQKPDHLLSEIGRVCREGAGIEIWTPYAFSHEAFIYGHAAFLTETIWYMFCVSHRDTFSDLLRGRWQLNSVTFVINPLVREDLRAHGFSLEFAVKYFKGVVEEFGVDITYRSDLAAPVVAPRRLWAESRHGERHELVPDAPEPEVQRRSAAAMVRSAIPESVKAPVRRLIAPYRGRTA
jgi:hypothetical protein